MQAEDDSGTQTPLNAQACPGRGWRLAVVLVLFVSSLLVLFPSGEFALRIDPSPHALTGAEDSSGSTSLIAGIFSESPLEIADFSRLAELESQLREVEGVVLTQSATSVRVPFTEADDIRVESWVERRPRVGDSSPYMDPAVLRNEPLIKGRLLSADGRSASISITIKGANDASRQAIARRVAQTIASWHAQQQPNNLEWEITGGPLIAATIGELMLEEMGLILPLAILLLSAVVLTAFRRINIVLASLATIVTALLWTMAAATALGWALNLVTIIIPPLVMCLAVSYGMHVIFAHGDAGSLTEGLERIRWPLLFSALTTAIGIGALGVNDLPSMRQFATLGTLAAVLSATACWTLLPLLLSLSKKPASPPQRLRQMLQEAASWTVRTVVKHSRQTLQIGTVLLLVCAAAATQVQPGARYIRDLSPEEPARQGFEKISEAFHGANAIDIIIEGAAPEVIVNANVLAALEDFQTWLLNQAEIGGAISALDYIKRIHMAFGSGRPEDARLPDNAALTKQLILVGAPEQFYDYTNLELSRMRIAVRTPVLETPILQELFARIESRLAELPPGLTARIEGEAVTLTRTMEQLTGSQLESLLISAGAIFLLLSVLFASARVGALAMLPNTLPVVAYFALLWATDTLLSPTTALVSCIVLGIAVDDTLHLLVRFNQLARERASEEEGSRQAVAEVLQPITLTTVAIACGFLTLISSPFHSQQMFGILAASTLVLAWLSDLFLAPAVSARSYIVTLWDVMRVDLGRAPNQTIPLFSGMTERQAQQFTLDASMRRLKPGERLITEGETGDEIYIVIDGLLRVWRQDEEGEIKVLNQCGRGESLGEVGLFAARRSASVSSIEKARVLAITAETLESVRHKNPKIAALAYRNLNRMQAKRALRDR